MPTGRKTKTVIVPKFEMCDNRDENKMYFIREWSAAKADTWIQKLTFAFNQGAGAIPMDMRGIGWKGLAVLGINTFLRGNGDKIAIMALCDELLECVQIVRDKANPENPSPIVSDDDIEEVATRWWLRDQVVSVHVNFSPAAALAALFRSVMSKVPTTSENTSTSPPE